MEKIFVLKSIIYDSRFDSSIFFESNPIYLRVTDKTYHKISRYDKFKRCRPDFPYCPCCAQIECKAYACAPFCPRSCHLCKCAEQLLKACVAPHKPVLFNEQQLYACLNPQKCCLCKPKRPYNRCVQRVAPQFHDELIF